MNSAVHERGQTVIKKKRETTVVLPAANLKLVLCVSIYILFHLPIFTGYVFSSLCWLPSIFIDNFDVYFLSIYFQCVHMETKMQDVVLWCDLIRNFIAKTMDLLVVNLALKQTVDQKWLLHFLYSSVQEYQILLLPIESEVRLKLSQSQELRPLEVLPQLQIIMKRFEKTLNDSWPL